MQIWALFSIDCTEYDQPNNNLIGWWFEKPSFLTLAIATGLSAFPCENDQNTLSITQIWSGNKNVRINDVAYTLQQISEGVILN